MTVRTFLIGLFIALVLIGGSFGIYWAFFSGTTVAPTANQTEDTGSAFPVIPGRTSSGSAQQTSASAAGQGAGAGEGTEGEGSFGTLTLSQNSGITERGKLAAIGNGPIAGYTLLGTGTSSVRYIEQTTGHIYELKEGETISDKVSNTTLPKIQHTYWSSDGKNLVLRVFADSLNTVENLLSTIVVATSTTGTATLGELKSSVLPRTIVDLTTSPDHKSLFYLNKVGEGVVGISADFQNKKQTQLFDSLRTEWTVDWPTQNTIALTPKASQNVPGTLYLLNSATKAVEKYLDGTLGLTTLVNHSKSFAFFNQSTQTGVLSSQINLASRGTSLLPTTTFPEKCVWSSRHPLLLYCGVPTFIPSGTYPDDWYKGSVSFQDRIELIDLETNETRILLTANSGPEGGFDAVELKLDPQEENLYFINKKDRSLWKLNLSL